MSIIRITLPLFLALAFVVPAFGADKPFDGTDLDALKAAVKADKRTLVATTLNLNAAEGQKFWPLYDAYQMKLDTLNRRRSRLVEDVVSQNRPLSDALAKNLLKEQLAIDDEEIKTLRAYQNRLIRALPAAKVARYLQLEGRIRTVQDYDVATVLPPPSGTVRQPHRYAGFARGKVDPDVGHALRGFFTPPPAAVGRLEDPLALPLVQAGAAGQQHQRGEEGKKMSYGGHGNG